MRSPQERNTRMENMCWRIWNLARKKKQVILFCNFFARFLGDSRHEFLKDKNVIRRFRFFNYVLVSSAFLQTYFCMLMRFLNS